MDGRIVDVHVVDVVSGDGGAHIVHVVGVFDVIDVVVDGHVVHVMM